MQNYQNDFLHGNNGVKLNLHLLISKILHQFHSKSDDDISCSLCDYAFGDVERVHLSFLMKHDRKGETFMRAVLNVKRIK